MIKMEWTRKRSGRGRGVEEEKLQNRKDIVAIHGHRNIRVYFPQSVPIKTQTEVAAFQCYELLKPKLV